MKADNKAVIADYRADNQIVLNLKKLGYDVISSMNNPSVSVHLSGHPDLQICKCSAKTYICAPECYDYYKAVLDKYNIELIMGKTRLSGNYPGDIAYNVARVGNSAIHNFRYTDSAITDFCKHNSINMINVSQGYSKCNICVVSDSAVITSDMGISAELIKHGLEALVISETGIDIFGWEHGFIGGASGRLDSDTIGFCGDLFSHGDGGKIEEFCLKHNVKCISLSDMRLMDLGSLISIG